MRGLAVEPTAWADLTDIYRFTCDRWSERQADRYLSGLFAAFQRIAAGTLRSRTATGVAADACVCGYRSHLIYWRVRADGNVGIVAVLHSHMDQLARARDAFGVST